MHLIVRMIGTHNRAILVQRVARAEQYLGLIVAARCRSEVLLVW